MKLDKGIKKELLEMLKYEMKEMMSEEKKGYMDEMMPEKAMQKVTVAGDSPEALEQGLSKAQEIMKAKMGDEYMDDSMGDYPIDEEYMDKMKKKKMMKK